MLPERLNGNVDRDRIGQLYRHLGFLGGSEVKNLPAVWKTWVLSLGGKDLLEKGKATHSSILAWRSPRTEQPAGLQSRGLQKDTTEQPAHIQAPVEVPVGGYR